MVELKTREEFLNMVTQLMLDRNDGEIVVIVSTPSRGVEVLSSHPNPATAVGVIEMGYKALDETFRMQVRANHMTENQREAEKMLEEYSKPPGKAN